MTGPANKRQKREDYQKAQRTANDGAHMELPKKKFYRQRAHANPFSDHNLTYPVSPSQMDWSTHFPAFVDRRCQDTRPGEVPRMSKQVEIADIGCGFGGLLIALSPILPNTLMIGMELRAQVQIYVTNRILALRSQNPAQIDQSLPPPTAAPTTSPSPSKSTPTPTAPTHLASSPNPGSYQNISALRTNTMKYLPNFFHRHQLTHLFLCFPDPHFKARKHKARIVSAQLNAEYAYVLRPHGRLYTITDVEELHWWIVAHFEGKCSREDRDGGHGEEREDEREARAEEGDRVKGVVELWERVSEEELARDPCVAVMSEETEEGKKVRRNGGRKFVAVWERREDPAWAGESE